MGNQTIQTARADFQPLSAHVQRTPASAASGKPMVFIVDADAAIRTALETLAQSAGLRAESFSSAESFLSRPRLVAASCLVMCTTLPGLSGLDLQRRIARDQPGIPIIFIADHSDVPTTVRAMKAGAVEFLTKPLADDVILSAIQSAVERSLEAFGHEAEMRELRARYESLSRREREVMALVVSGLMNKQAGGILGINENTVKAHRGRVMEKMRARSFAALVNMDARLCGARFQQAQTPAARLQDIDETFVQ